MRGNIVGEPFDGYVAREISRRQTRQGKGFDSPRTNEDLLHISNKNSWVKLASSVLVENTPNINEKNGDARLLELGVPDPNKYLGDNLAKNFILFNGIQKLDNGYVSRKGIFSNDTIEDILAGNSAYGLGGSKQGLQPMPSITSASIKCLNMGSIRKATINIKAYNKTQFHLIELLYLRLGFTMMLEWGWDKYIDDNGNIRDVNNTIIENFWFTQDTCSGISQIDIIKEIEKTRSNYNGSYDGFYGRVVNYSWDFKKDGSYNIILDLITIGDVIESLKLNLPSSITLLEIQEASSRPQNNLEGSKLLEVAGSNKLGAHLFKKIKNYNAKVKDNNFVKIPGGSSDGENYKYPYYIRFGYLLDYIQRYILPLQSSTSPTEFNNTGESILSIRTDDSQYYKKFPGQISIDPRICLSYIDTSFQTLNTNQPILDVSIVNTLNNLFPVSLFIKNNKLMDILLNVEFVGQTIKNSTNSDMDFFLYKFLEKICDGINLALGSVNKIKPIIDQDKEIVFIDETLSYEEINGKPESEVQLEVYGYNPNNRSSNFVKDINFQTKLSPKISSMISIGATAENNNTKNIDATAFSKWNSGLRDKFNLSTYTNNNNESQDKVLSSTDEVKKELAKHYKATPKKKTKNWVESATLLTELFLYYYTDWYEIPYDNKTFTVQNEDDFITQALNHLKQKIENIKSEENKETDTWVDYLIDAFNINGEKYLEMGQPFIEKGIQLYKSYLKEHHQNIYNLTQQPSSVIGFIPVNFNITLEGISGIKIYQKLNIRQEFLPPQYPKALKFLITGVDHNINNNNWDTKISTISTSNIDNDLVQNNKMQKPIQTKNNELIEELRKNQTGDFSLIYNGKLVTDKIQFVKDNINFSAQKNFAQFFTLLDQYCKGYTAEVTSFVRSFKKQRSLKNQGKTTADAGRSAHNYAAAIDINIISPSGERYSMNTSYNKWKETNIPKYAEQSNLKWGGNFKNNYDPVHIAYPFDVNVAINNIKRELNINEITEEHFNKIIPKNVSLI